jgi:hypothetical protein
LHEMPKVKNWTVYSGKLVITPWRRRMETWLYAFLTSAVDGSKWSASDFFALSLG